MPKGGHDALEATHVIECEVAVWLAGTSKMAGAHPIGLGQSLTHGGIRDVIKLVWGQTEVELGDASQHRRRETLDVELLILDTMAEMRGYKLAELIGIKNIDGKQTRVWVQGMIAECGGRTGTDVKNVAARGRRHKACVCQRHR